MSLPKLAIERPITTAMLLLSIAVFGGIALAKLPLAFLPDIDAPFIGVQIPYPSSNPAQIEKEIIKPVEEILATLSGVKRLDSRATADSAELFLEFAWGRDLDVVRMQVSEKIDQIRPELPEGIEQILITSFKTSDIPVVEARISAEGVDLSSNYELLESRVLNRLRRIPGVARVDLDGVEPRQIYIDIILSKLKEHQIDLDGIVKQLESSASNLVLGEVHEGGRRYSARALTAFGSFEALNNMVINERGLRLRDVAEIVYAEPPIAYGRFLNQQDAIALTVFKESTANTVDVVRTVMGTIENDINQDPLLQGVSLFVWENQADQIVNAVSGLRQSGMIGALLATLVLYFFLRRFSSTLIVSLSIPFSIIASCGVLYFMGKTLNVLSMMGLMLGVGMLVDNAIVVLESIDRKRRHEPDSRKAALGGAQDVGLAVTASTATSLIVFLPLIVGADSPLTTWLGEVGIPICLALVCSLLSALTLIPLMAAPLLRHGSSQPVPVLNWLEARYAQALGWTLKHPWKMLALLILSLGLTALPFAAEWIEASPFSAAVNERLALDYKFSDFLYKFETKEIVEEVERHLVQHKEEFLIDSIYSYYTANDARTTLTLTRQDLDDKEYKALRKKIRDSLPEIAGVRLLFNEDTDQGGGSTYFSVNFFGQDSGVLAQFAEEAKRRLETVAGVVDTSISTEQARQEIQVKIDRAKAARLGLTAEDLSRTFGFTLGGLRLPRFNAGEREIEASLALRLEDRQNLADLKQIEIRAVGGRPVVLGEIAEFIVSDKPQEIERQNRKVRVAVKATYEGKDWDEARKEMEGLMNAFSLPGGYSWSFNERILEQDTQNQQMVINLLLALALVYLVMAALFESLAQPFAILFSILFAFPGAAWLLAVTQTPFNLMAQIGLLILMGIVVNNGIVLLDHMNQLRRQGMERSAAVLAAGRDRLRAILMTALTTIIGLLPMAIGGSQVGGLFYYPLAMTVMGGLSSSTILTLLVLPWIDHWIEALASWLRRTWAGSAESLAAASPTEQQPAEA